MLVDDAYTLTEQEKIALEGICKQMMDGELAQTKDLIQNCNNKYQFAKTHSIYLKDWEKMRAQMESNLATGKLPPNVSENLHKAVIAEAAKIIEAKLERFGRLFNRS